MNISSCDRGFKSVLESARRTASDCQHEYVGAEHVLYCLCRFGELSPALAELDISRAALERVFEAYGKHRAFLPEEIDFSPRLQMAIGHAIERGRLNGHSAHVNDLAVALLQQYRERLSELFPALADNDRVQAFFDRLE